MLVDDVDVLVDVVVVVLVVVVGKPTASVWTIVGTLSDSRREHVDAVTSSDVPVSVKPITSPSAYQSAMHVVVGPAVR